jgi:putative ABC transport system substrate-binding protein
MPSSPGAKRTPRPLTLGRVWWAAGLGAWAFLSASWAGASGKVVVLVSRSAEPYLVATRGFQGAVGLEPDLFNMEGNLEKAKAYLDTLTPGAVRLLVSVGTEAGQAERALDPAIPVVYTMVMEPLEMPRRQATGVVIKLSIEDQFQRVQKLFPGRKRIGVIYNPQYSSRDIEQARKLAPQYDLALMPLAVEKAEEVPEALPKLSRGSVDLIWMVPDKTVAAPAAVQAMVAHALREGIPLIGLSMYHVKSGALAAFSVDFGDLGAQTAKLALRVLAGGSTPPVETPRRVIIYVNPKVQKQLGLEDLSVFPEVSFVQ